MSARRFTAPDLFLPKTAPSEVEAAALLEINEVILLHQNAIVTGDWWTPEKKYRRLLAKYPGSPRTTFMLGLLLQQKAEQTNPRAIAMMIEGAEGDPHDALVHGQLGAVLYHQGRITESRDAYRRAVDALPSYDDAYAALGRVFTDLCGHDEALYCYERALAVQPENYGFWCDYIFIGDLAPSTTFDSALAARRRFNETMVLPRLAESVPHRNDRDPDRKLRIGYVSADMYQHSGAMTWGGFVVNHDRSKFYITLYSNTEKEDEMTQRFKESCDQWSDIRGWTDDRLAMQIMRDKIDILVDLATFTKGGRVLAFARRPAPIQVSGWGYATGTGLDCMDYFATDKVVVPDEDAARYHEKPWYLLSALSWVHPQDDMPVSHLRAALGSPFTFGVLNRQPKITRPSMEAWVEIVRRTPGSMLLVKNQRMESDDLRTFMRDLAVECGARYDDGNGQFGKECLYVPTAGDPSRIVFSGQSTHFNQLAAHWAVDVMLDPFPQGGGVSAFESLWMGVPLVTLTGERPPGRIGTSLLHQVGLEDWAAPTVEAYIERAVEASKDIPRLKTIRETLRERTRGMPALDLHGYARKVEAGFRAMWQRWLRETEQEAAA